MRAFLLSGAASALAGLGAALVAVCALAGAGEVTAGPLVAVGSTVGIGLSVTGSLLLVLEALGVAQAARSALDAGTVRRLLACAAAVLCAFLFVMFAVGTAWAAMLHPDRPALLAGLFAGVGVSMVAGLRFALRAAQVTAVPSYAASAQDQWALAWAAVDLPLQRNWP